MGLAASQARFLAITSRKMNCEFQSMQLAQEKLSITRDLQKASQQYQSALDASKLVWQVDDFAEYNLTYDTMMQPTALNNYDPYILTDSRGRIVLNKSMFDAAVEAGVINQNGEPIGNYTAGTAASKDDGSRNAFLFQLGVKNQANGTIVSQVVALGDEGYTNSGIGGKIFDKTTAGDMKTNTFIKFLSSENEDGTLKYDFNTYFKNVENIALYNGGSKVDDPSKISIGEILEGNYYIVNVEGGPSLDAASIAGAVRYLFDMLNVGPQTKAALECAKGTIEGYYSTDKKAGGSSSTPYSTSVGTAIEKAKSYETIVTYGSAQALNLSNMLKAFLTEFAIEQEGYANGLMVHGTNVSGSNYVTKDLNYVYTVKADGQKAMSDQEMLYADFYNMLYNNLCMYGACTDGVMQEQVMDDEYLSYALKNAQVFVSSLHTDGYFYQGHYTQNGHIGEVPDEDAIARAELEYEITKSKLNYKEENIELKTKNLDMEISALTTEFDTVKNLISKGIEKVFTMFST